MATVTTRIMTALIVVAGLLAVAMTVHPEWLTGIPSGKGAAATSELVSHPAERSEVVSRRIRAKADIIARLLADELTLFQAASLFSYVNGLPTGMEDVSWKKQPGGDDGERLCRQVITWVRAELGTRCVPSEVEIRLERLERQLHQQIVAHGGVTLESR